MSRHARSRYLTARLPEQMAEALQERAEHLGVPTAAVVREAVARELAVPLDERSRDFVSAWLEGRDSAEAGV
jgi:predicted transcriptional regulator